MLGNYKDRFSHEAVTECESVYGISLPPITPLAPRIFAYTPTARAYLIGLPISGRSRLWKIFRLSAMACDFFTSAASNAVGTLMVDYLVKPVERRLRYLFRFNNIVEELQEQETKLTVEQTRVKVDVDEAKLQPQTQVIEEYVEKWLIEAESVFKDVQSLQRRIEENKRCFRLCPNWCWRYQLSKEIEQKTLAARKLIESSKFDRYGHRAPLPGIEFFGSEGYLASRSATAAFNEITAALKSDEVNMIGVWGMGGVGKTTLVTEVRKKVKEFQLFDRVIKVVVTQTPIVENIQNKIADFLDLKFQKTTQEGKAEELWIRLENERKVIIILDDLWNKLNLKEIGIPLGGDRKGCKIILTTRRRPVCEYMASQATVSLGVLDEDEAWTLFRTKASLDEENDHAETIKVAREVAKECKGLPVAIVTLARALKGTKSVKGWEVARKKLESSRLMEISNIEEDEKNAYMCLKISYDHLKKDTTKRCFLLCALYPEDHSIDVEELVRYASGLGIYRNATSMEEVRFEVLEAIDYLKDSCLLLEDGERHIKMHDMIRDVAMWITSKEGNGLVTKPGVESENESSRQKLEILLIDNYDSKTPIESFEAMRELKVLSLKRASKIDASVFPLNALKSLTNLRALQLKGFKQLEGISHLAKLTKLEILSLDGSEFEESVDKLGELKNIRVLDIQHCKFLLGFPPTLIRKLVKVEELYLHYSAIRKSFPAFGTEKASINTIILRDLNCLPRLASLSFEVPSQCLPEDFVFPRLERYQIAINAQYLWTDLKTISSRFLKISQELPLNVISELLANVESFELSRIKEKTIKCLTDASPGNVLVGTILRNLKHMSIDKCMNLQMIFQMKKAENHALLLTELKDLSLMELPNLEYIWKMPTQQISLRSLEAVKIDGCGKLKFLFSFSLAQSLIRLQLLEINGCGELEQIIQELGVDGQEISPHMNPDKSLCFPKLSNLVINNCDSLEYIFPKFMAPRGLPQLQKLSMTRLSQLKQICKAGNQREENGIMLPQLQILPSLTDLTLTDCPKLADATVHAEPVQAYLKEIQLSRLEEALILLNTKVISLKRIIGDHNLIPEIDRNGLNGLTLLEVRSCESLEYLVDTTKEHVPDSAFNNLVELFLKRLGGLKMMCNGQFPKGFLQNLKKLTVKQCNQLQEVFQINELFYTREENQAQLLSNLEQLELYHLPELRWILKGSDHYFSLQSLKVVMIFSCKKLKSFFSSSLIQSLQQLEELQIRFCDEFQTLFATESNNSHLHQLCLPRLKSLCIDGCPRLEYILPMSLAQGLPQLESVYACASPQLKQVFGTVAKQHDGNVEHCINLPLLKDLRLYYLRNLGSFGPENYFVKAPALQSLSVWRCPQLKKLSIQQEFNNRNNNEVYLEEVGLFPFKEFLHKAKDLTLENIRDQKYLLPDVDLEGLTSLQLWNCKELEYLVDTIQESSGILSNLVNLELSATGLKMLCNGQPPKGFLQNLETLTIDRCMDIVSLYIMAQNLRELVVRDSAKLQAVFRIDEILCTREENQLQPLSSLDKLVLLSVPELRWIVKGPSQYVSLRSLKFVRIEECNKLESLFSSSIIRSLRLLEELQVSKCDNLERVFAKLEGDDATESNTPCLPNMKTLEITECPRLKYVLPLASAQGLLRLQKLQLCGLRNLISFGRENYFLKAPALEDLQVSDCPRLSNFTIQQDKPLQPTLPGGYNIMSSLETMEFGGLIWLRDIWKGTIQVAVTNLRVLRVYDCNTLTYLFPLMLIQNLRNLSTLDIMGCQMLKQIIVGDDMLALSSQGHDKDETGVKTYKEELMMFPQLDKLSLDGLPSLVSFSSVGYHLVFPSLESLNITGCSWMTTNFSVDPTLTVHAKTKDVKARQPDIRWTPGEPTSLPLYVEEANEILASK